MKWLTFSVIFLTFVLTGEAGLLAGVPATGGAATRITVLQPFPLPSGAPLGGNPHERVFTNEIYSKSPTEREVIGWFVPEEYIRIITNNLWSIAEQKGLYLQLADSIGDIKEEPDAILLIAVKQFSCGKTADVVLDVMLLNGKDFGRLGQKTFERHIQNDRVPFIMERPVHMIGKHAVDFHPQRTLLNLAVYGCVQDLFEFVAQEVK